MLGFLVLAVLGASLVLLLAAFAQALRLLVSVENSNRQNAELLRTLLKQSQANGSGDGDLAAGA
jgi:hypothetical protein